MFLNQLKRRRKRKIRDDITHKNIYKKILNDKSINIACNKYNVNLSEELIDEIISVLVDTINRWMNHKLPYIKIPYIGRLFFKVNYFEVRKHELKYQTRLTSKEVKNVINKIRILPKAKYKITDMINNNYFKYAKVRDIIKDKGTKELEKGTQI